MDRLLQRHLVADTPAADDASGRRGFRWSRRIRIPAAKLNLPGRPSKSNRNLKASPRTAEYDPGSFRSRSKRLRQTGSRETRIRGKPQMRQSVGKKLKNKVAATRSAKPAKPLLATPGLARSSLARPCLATRWSTAWPWAARIRNPVLLLLKTASCTRVAAGAQANLSQYNCGLNPTQRVASPFAPSGGYLRGYLR